MTIRRKRYDHLVRGMDLDSGCDMSAVTGTCSLPFLMEIRNTLTPAGRAAKSLTRRTTSKSPAKPGGRQAALPPSTACEAVVLTLESQWVILNPDHAAIQNVTCFRPRSALHLWSDERISRHAPPFDHRRCSRCRACGGSVSGRGMGTRAGGRRLSPGQGRSRRNHRHRDRDRHDQSGHHRDRRLAIVRARWSRFSPTTIPR